MIMQPALFAGMPAHIGRKGQRLKMNLRLLHKYESETGYYRFTYVFIAPCGNSLVWKTEMDADLIEGGEYDVAFTVKAHSHYKGKKQTQITRPAFK